MDSQKQYDNQGNAPQYHKFMVIQYIAYINKNKLPQIPGAPPCQ